MGKWSTGWRGSDSSSAGIHLPSAPPPSSTPAPPHTPHDGPPPALEDTPYKFTLALRDGGGAETRIELLQRVAQLAARGEARLRIAPQAAVDDGREAGVNVQRQRGQGGRIILLHRERER